MELTCSLEDCRAPVVGTGVLLSNLEGTDAVSWQGLQTYVGSREGRQTEWVILHPTCFVQLFEEMSRQQVMSVLMMAMGAVGDMKIALSM